MAVSCGNVNVTNTVMNTVCNVKQTRTVNVVENRTVSISEGLTHVGAISIAQVCRVYKYSTQVLHIFPQKGLCEKGTSIV